LGAQVTISGTVERAVANPRGDITIDVRDTSPCRVEWVRANTARPPASCRGGATITAAGKVDEVLGVILMADTFKCRKAHRGVNQNERQVHRLAYGT
jgi:hypothetical protein